MDTEPEELRFLNIFGILRESFKVLLSHTKLFIALTLTLIIPLCVVGLGHTLITEPISGRIMWDRFLARSHDVTPAQEEKIDEDLNKQQTKLFIVFAIYFFFLLAFSLLSTSAVVYSVACIYSEKITSYKKVLSVVPRVWKRLIVTFLWALLMMFSYAVIFFLAFFLVVMVCGAIFSSTVAINVVIWAGVVVLWSGIIYINCVWHLGSVITVLEESYGLGAMRKSLRLIKGKQMVAFGLFLMYFVLTFLIGLGFAMWVVHGRNFHVSGGWRVVLGSALILALSLVDLLGFLVQTVFYFACKAHHHESIDKLQLSEHLGAYLGEYAPLRGSIQLEAFEA